MFFSRTVTAWFPYCTGVGSAFHLHSRTSFRHIWVACSLWIAPPAGAFRNILLKWIANDCKHKCGTKCNTKCSTFRLFSTTSKSQVSASKTLRKSCSLPSGPSLAKYRCLLMLFTSGETLCLEVAGVELRRGRGCDFAKSLEICPNGFSLFQHISCFKRHALTL